jgi:hypothetical protein
MLVIEILQVCSGLGVTATHRVTATPEIDRAEKLLNRPAAPQRSVG